MGLTMRKSVIVVLPLVLLLVASGQAVAQSTIYAIGMGLNSCGQYLSAVHNHPPGTYTAPGARARRVDSSRPRSTPLDTGKKLTATIVAPDRVHVSPTSVFPNSSCLATGSLNLNHASTKTCRPETRLPGCVRSAMRTGLGQPAPC